MDGMHFDQDDQKRLIRGRYNYQNIPISMHYSSINLTPQPPLLPLPLPLSNPNSSAQPKKPTRPTSHQSLFTPKKTKPPPSPHAQRAQRMGRRASEKFMVRSASVGASLADLDDYSELIHSVSPDPSSLPLPRFALPRRAKVVGTCKLTDAGQL